MRFGVRGFWLNDRFYPIMAGAEGDGGEGGEGGAAGSGNDGGTSGSSGGSEGGSGASGGSDPPKDNNDGGDLKKALNESRARERAAAAKLAEIENKQREADRKAAEERGEFERLYNESKTESERQMAVLQAQVRANEGERALLNYLLEKQPTYTAKMRWMLPVLHGEVAKNPELDADGLQGIAERVVKDYVKDHPLQTEGRGAPGGANGSGGRNGPDPLAGFPGLAKKFGDQK
jgi:hypothetical protein